MCEVWKIMQSNGLKPILCVDLEDNKFSGSATQSTNGVGYEDGSTRGIDKGIIHNGFIHSNQIKFTIEWINGSIGEYNGIIGLDGRIYGIGIETTTNDVAYWVSIEPTSLHPKQATNAN